MCQNAVVTTMSSIPGTAPLGASQSCISRAPRAAAFLDVLDVTAFATIGMGSEISAACEQNRALPGRRLDRCSQLHTLRATIIS